MAQLNPDGAQASIEHALDATGATVVKLSGEIDISNARQISTALERIVEGTVQLVIDLSALEFMDSAGIAMLLRLITRVESAVIRNPSSVVRRILECTGLTEILTIES